MKRFKKMMAIVIVLVMTMMYVVPMSYAATTTVTNGTPTHNYNVYQIFSGTQTGDSNDTRLGDIAWGTGVSNPSGLIAALQADTRFGSGTSNIFNGISYDSTNPNASAIAVAEALDGVADKSDTAKALANDIAKFLSATSTALASGASSIDLNPGYYLFVDVTSGITSDDALNSALLQITGKDAGLTIEKKYDVPSLDKDITKVNSTEVEIEATDVNIGDTVEYTLTGTLPSNYDDYEVYHYKFTDTITKGQSVPAKGETGGITVTLDNDGTTTDITSYFTISPDTAIDGTAASTTITITNNDLKTTIPAVTSSSKIIVKYTATITKDAVTGSSGQSNTAKITYDNNPNFTGNGTPPTSDTPEDTTLVFTYELDTTKVDGANSATKLKDAQFVLKATNGDHQDKYVKVESDGTIGWLDTEPNQVAENTTATAAAATGVLISGTNGLFQVKGLDAGNYELKEIKAPKGYNLLTNAIPITITATVVGSDTSTHDNVTPELTALTITVNNGTATNGDVTNGTVSMDVLNNAGAELPSTGGIGTTMFYLIGAILVVGAGVILVTRRRVDGQQ